MDRSSTQHTLSQTRKELLFFWEAVSFLHSWQQCQVASNNKIYWPHPLPLIWAGVRIVTTERLGKMWARENLMGWRTWLHMTNAEVLNAFFAPAFILQTGFQESQFQETVEKVGTRKMDIFWKTIRSGSENT